MRAESNAEPASPRQRVRIVYERGEAIKFISHQDEFRAWERTLRRAGLPLLYKQGFHPQPHMQFAAPLGVGFTGSQELLDAIFSPPVPLDHLYQRITGKLPPGLFLRTLEEVPLAATALQSVLIGADYTILLYAEPDEVPGELIGERIDAFLAAEEIWRERERKGQPYRYNLRRLIFELTYQGYSAEREEHRIFLRVQQREGATGRPDEVVAALGFNDLARTLRRERLYFENCPDDSAIFAAYPVVTQAEVSISLASRGRRRDRRREPASHADRGRSIGERAADEFI
jgi:radical SAM-linked protein